LRNELERDRTKTYVVEISPLGLVEMTRQNVTDGPREILTKKCPTCAGDGIVVSEATAALEVERRLRTLAAGSRAQAFQIEVEPKTMSLLLGTGGKRLAEIEEASKKRFFLVPKEGVHADHAAVLAEGKLADLQPPAPIAEGTEVEVKLVELDKHDAGSAVGKLDGIDVVVGGAAKLVGKKAKVRVERVLDGVAYATALKGVVAPEQPITFESEAEKPTRAPTRAKKAADADAETEDLDADATELEAEAEEPEVGDAEAAPDDEPDDVVEEPAADGAAPVKKKTRRGSRGGRNRKKKPAAAGAEAGSGGEAEAEAVADGEAPSPTAPRIHVPDFDLEAKPAARTRAPKPRPAEVEASDEASDAVSAEPESGDEAAPVKKKTRRGSRGGRNRKKPAAAGGAATTENGAEPQADAVEAQPEPSGNGAEPASDEYVPMSEWLDDLDK
jgi:ribonuclease G